MKVFKNIMLVLLGMVLAVGIFCAVVGIGCAINGITFSNQITNWFGTTATATKTATKLLRL